MLRKALQIAESGEKSALVIVTKSEGSTPAQVGKMMMVGIDGSFEGTVGGGKLEYDSIKLAVECISGEKDMAFTFDLEKDLKMNCGGYVEIFIKTFKPEKTLFIIGGGHIGLSLDKYARLLKFKTVIVDNREEIANTNRFPDAHKVILGDMKDECKKLKTNTNSYIVITTHGHAHDEDALEGIIRKQYKYLGVIGSRKKVDSMFSNLENKGVDRALIDGVYSPIGLNLGGNSPEEIALSIMAEIVMIKNGGTSEHMKDR